MKRLVAAVVLSSLLMGGCGSFRSRPAKVEPGVSPASPGGAAAAPAPGSGPGGAISAGRPSAPAASSAPDLLKVSNPRELTLPELEAGLLRYMNLQGDVPPAQALAGLLGRWRLPGPVTADLDGDGSPELVTPLQGSDGSFERGALFVLHRTGGRWEVAVSSGQEPRGLGLVGVRDLTGDGKPEVVWFWLETGAHTATATVVAASWQGGRLVPLPADPMSITDPRVELDGSDLVLSGGLIGSVGAGPAQRPRTDRYRWKDGRFQLADRRFAPSDLAYHRLIDGLVAESFGRDAEARAAFASAMEPSRMALELEMAGPDPEVAPGAAEGLGEAVRAFARFRAGLLLARQGDGPGAVKVLGAASGPHAGLSRSLAETLSAGRPGARNLSEGCRAAEAWARSNPDFLERLNSPYGYANPHWEPDSLCTGLPRTSE